MLRASSSYPRMSPSTTASRRRLPSSVPSLAVVPAQRVAVREPRVLDDRGLLERGRVGDRDLDVEPGLIVAELVALHDSHVLADRSSDLVEVRPAHETRVDNEHSVLPG